MQCLSKLKNIPYSSNKAIFYSIPASNAFPEKKKLKLNLKVSYESSRRLSCVLCGELIRLAHWKNALAISNGSI